MQKTVVINVVGLSSALIGSHTPFLQHYIEDRHLHRIKPMLASVTNAVQSTYLTGNWPNVHGIVGNGWYDRTDCEVKFWKQSNKLVQGEKIWERAKKLDPSFTCSKMFWWYNMYSSADYTVTPRPNYLADGRKLPDCYSQPASLRDELQRELGQFPLFQFWGAGANIISSRWIAEASMYTDKKYDPTLTLIYLPHLDYCLQKFGPDIKQIASELADIDRLVDELVTYYEQRDTRVIILSEYGITPVNTPVHLNRILRKAGLLHVRVERGLELLDAGASKAFAVADHQIAHVYLHDPTVEDQVVRLLSEVQGVERVLDRRQQEFHQFDHERAGDLVVMADKDSWFTYYFWEDDSKAPDYARTVDIHKKPGYDPVEMFMTSKLRAGYKLLRKKVGLRYVMDVVPLDATLIKGSHGRIHDDEGFYPVIITEERQEKQILEAIDVHDVILKTLTKA